MKNIKLRNGVEMPVIMLGTSICDLKGDAHVLQKQLEQALTCALRYKAVGFDTARDYNNEELLGQIFNRMIRKHICKREDLFITTKVGNEQQRHKDMETEIDLSLKHFNLDYIDLWLLHWPLPDYYLDNWKQIEKIYRSGKVRAIGVANCRERHIKALKEIADEMPHVVQIEYHPFRTVPSMRTILKDENIQLEAYSANCVMLPFVRENPVLNGLAHKYNKSVTQIMMRWHIQQGSIPIFRSFNLSHIKENIDIFDFSLSDEDMDAIFGLDIDYKFHPESLNCPGY
jgi:diketogulonate reductase-like aldo/keto reductase